MGPEVGNLLHTSWHDPAWIPMLNPHNIMDYFSERTNPFYDRTCNNEMLKMQRASMEQLTSMVGTEYCLLYVQEPILYVVRKQHRSSPSQVTPIADYYIIAGVVHQAPDLSSVLSSRLLSAVTHLQSAFEEARSYAKYHPSRGYWWDFSAGSSASSRGAGKSKGDVDLKEENAKKKIKKKREEKQKKAAEQSSMFQRRRVDYLLDLWCRKFPPRVAAPANQQPLPSSNPPSQAGDKADDVKSEKDAVSVKTEKDLTVNGEQRGIKRENPNQPNVKSEAKKPRL